VADGPTDRRPFNVLFICTGNSARSIMAEAILNHVGRGRFAAFSAGSHPTGVVNPLALDQLARAGISTEGLRSKPWEEFATPDALPLDFTLTVCDNAAGEMCPVWPGRPTTAHWGVPDPAAMKGSDADKRRAFRDAFAVLERRIALFVSLPFDELDRVALRGRLQEIGRS